MKTTTRINYSTLPLNQRMLRPFLNQLNPIQLAQRHWLSNRIALCHSLLTRNHRGVIFLTKQRPSSQPRPNRGEKEFWAEETSNPGLVGLAVAPTLNTPAIGIWVSSHNLRLVPTAPKNPKKDPSIALAGVAVVTGDSGPTVAVAGTSSITGDPEAVLNVPLKLSPVAHED